MPRASSPAREAVDTWLLYGLQRSSHQATTNPSRRRWRRRQRCRGRVVGCGGGGDSVCGGGSAPLVLSRAQQAAAQVGRVPGSVRMTVVSKTKQVLVIRGIYDASHHCLGESYFQELIDKAPRLACIAHDSNSKILPSVSSLWELPVRTLNRSQQLVNYVWC